MSNLHAPDGATQNNETGRRLTTTEWARENGEAFRWHAATDNYEPIPRNVAYGTLYTYERGDDDEGIIIEDASELKDARDAIYLVDDGATVRPFYVAAWHPEGDHLILHPFPTNVKRDGTPRLRADNFEPVDFRHWKLGPRRSYHLKVTPLFQQG